MERTGKLRAVFFGALAAFLLVSPVGAALGSKFTRVDSQDIAGSGQRQVSMANSQITVVVVLSGDSVAQAQAAAGHKLSKQEKDAIKAQRNADQQAVVPQIQATGGQVITTFQSAVNGVKVKIARDQLDALRQIPGVVDIKPVNVYQRDNTIGVPRVQAPAAWAGVPGFRGEGIKIVVIDTGIDFTHANFGGPGTTAAYNTAKASGTAAASPLLFGQNAPKVKGGTDLVGDSYNADPNADPSSAFPYQPVPHPDPNPLDCAGPGIVGHGSHVAGTATGLGVLDNGTTYTGPYDSTTYTHSFRIGPGVAPKADLYSVRVFGCEGSTDVVVEALDWAVDNDMDVVNMSLGSSYGPADSADALASDAAVKAGIIVVASAGNSNDLRYITGSPASSKRTVSVAAADTPAIIPFGDLVLPAVTGDAARTISAIDANGAAFNFPTPLTVKVVRNTNGTVSLGCNVAAFQANGGVVGKVAVVQRGTCARVAKAIFGQQAGAVAVVMVNTTTALPPNEGTIFQNPDDGIYYSVTIPFFGVRGTVSTATSDGARLVLRDGLAININNGTPQQTGIASFSSGGPRSGDSGLKPDITAPGSPIISTFAGSGNLQESLSGTSMASPHVAGIAALGQQAHPGWKPSQIKAAIINSGNPDQLANYVTHTAGSGFVNATSVAHTQVTASADEDATNLNFGLVEFSKDYSKNGVIKLRNDGDAAATFNVAVTRKQGSPHTVTLGTSQIKVQAHDTSTLDVTLAVPAASAGDSSGFRDVAGLVVFTPASSADNGGIALRVPYYLVPRVSSNVSAALDKKLKAQDPTGTVNLANAGSPIGATADFYSWGLARSSSNGKRNSIVDLNAAGAQSFVDGTDQAVAFAVNVEQGWSAAQTRELDVYIDLDGDGTPEYVVFNVDLGLLTAGAYNGQTVAAIKNLSTGDIGADYFVSTPTDTSTMVLPVLAASIGVTASSPRFSYTVVAFSSDGTQDAFKAFARYNAFSSAITNSTNGDVVALAPNANASVNVSVNLAEWALTPALGLMVITPDNKNGTSEANLIDVKF